MKAQHELQVLAVFVHGVLFAFHGLGIIYNKRKGNKKDVLCHSLALAYELWALRKHILEVKDG